MAEISMKMTVALHDLSQGRIHLDLGEDSLTIWTHDNGPGEKLVLSLAEAQKLAQIITAAARAGKPVKRKW